MKRRSHLKVEVGVGSDLDRTVLKTLASHQRRAEAGQKVDVGLIVRKKNMRLSNHSEVEDDRLVQQIVTMM